MHMALKKRHFSLEEKEYIKKFQKIPHNEDQQVITREIEKEKKQLDEKDNILIEHIKKFSPRKLGNEKEMKRFREISHYYTSVIADLAKNNSNEALKTRKTLEAAFLQKVIDLYTNIEPTLSLAACWRLVEFEFSSEPIKIKSVKVINPINSYSFFENRFTLLMTSNSSILRNTSRAIKNTCSISMIYVCKGKNLRFLLPRSLMINIPLMA